MNRKILRVMLFFFGIILVVTAVIAAVFVLSNGHYSVVDVRQETFNTSVGPIRSSTTHGQSFTANYPGLHRIEVFVGTYGKKIRTQPVLRLKTSARSKNNLRRVRGTAKLKDNEYYAFAFRPVDVSRKKKLYFVVEFQPKDSKTFTIWHSSRNLYPGGSRYKNGKRVSGDLSFRTYAKTSLSVIVSEFAQQTLFTRVVAGSLLFYVLTLIIVVRSSRRVNDERNRSQ